MSKSDTGEAKGTEVDDLPPTQYLMLEVLAARYRTGEQLWTFPKRMRQIARELEDQHLVRWKGGVAQDTIMVWLTDSGMKAMLSEDYTPPCDREPAVA